MPTKAPKYKEGKPKNRLAFRCHPDRREMFKPNLRYGRQSVAIEAGGTSVASEGGAKRPNRFLAPDVFVSKQHKETAFMKQYR
jgi:hypothetical protein